jgi:hypothetical protein
MFPQQEGALGGRLLVLAWVCLGCGAVLEAHGDIPPHAAGPDRPGCDRRVS